jgi:hypothetical protein
MKLINWIKKEYAYITGFVSMVYSRMLLDSGGKMDPGVIPYGPSCRRTVIDKDGDVVFVVCPYYKAVGPMANGCMFTGITTNETYFAEKIKMCRVNVRLIRPTWPYSKF